MRRFFEQIDHLIGDAEWISLAVSILIIVLIITFIVLNIVVCVCVISMKKSLKEIANKDQPKKEIKNQHNQ